VTRIVRAALHALADDPHASMGAIARRAGLGRTTVYAHFPDRDALIDAVTQHAVADVRTAIEASDPDRGDPSDALARVVRAVWRTLGRYHALVAINTRRLRPDELDARHAPLLDALEPLIVRGQDDGVFRADVPAGWHLAIIVATMHTASQALQHRRLPEPEVERALLATILGALAPTPDTRSRRS
jgi:AcrR family transcriptional regulator